MRTELRKSIIKSLEYHRKDSVLLVIIIALLAAIITGSLFSGTSVRASLKKTVSERLGNTDILVSSGLRYFNASISGRISTSSGVRSVTVLESDGFCQNFKTGSAALNIKIYGIDDDFFPFYGTTKIKIDPGHAAINRHLADLIGIDTGDEIILHLRDTDPVPEDAPFAPSDDNTGSIVLRVSDIRGPEKGGDFSSGVNQMTPLNVFLNRQDLKGMNSAIEKANRLYIQNTRNYKDSSFSRIIRNLLEPADIGLSFRRSLKTGEYEIISDRVFIDSLIVNLILKLIPEGYPVLTYLGNSFEHSELSSPYSFIAALPSLNSVLKENEIVINSWLAQDINAKPDDTLRLKWFDPGSNRLLKEKTRDFIIKDVIGYDSELSDSMLMPAFPGISGSKTCAGWDAGVPIRLDRIREKDELYWNMHRGTPKAFISYGTGKALWGNNFGPATAIRFPASIDSIQIKSRLKGNLTPSLTGFTITDLRNANNNAAGEGVDFSMLFLCLSIFMIVSCMVLISILFTLYLESRKDQVRAFTSIGYRNNLIMKLLLAETGIISVIGAGIGIFAGYIINMLIIKALNSVWYGAVQMNTITPVFSPAPVLEGFFTTIVLAFLLLYFKVRNFLRNGAGTKTGLHRVHSEKKSLVIVIISFSAFLITSGISLLSGRQSIPLSFTSGIVLFISMILMLRHYFIMSAINREFNSANYSRSYYRHHPSQALSPALFIAAGIFALAVTGSNRQFLNKKMLQPDGGTGGYQLWAESAIPVKADLRTAKGRKEFGFDEPAFRDIKFVVAKRVSGDNASCLNINHVTSPPLLGFDAAEFVRKGAFSFASEMKNAPGKNPWEILDKKPGTNTIYGIADQSVLEWSLKLKTGDTLKYRSEDGQVLNIIICAGLRSSLFQGYVLIGEKNLEHYFPSVPGSSVFLVECSQELTTQVRDDMSQRLSAYGISVIPAGEKLTSFFSVTNTYIEVFMVLGILGLILGSAGFGLIMIRNFNERKREFALLAATGYTDQRIRRLLMTDQVIILLWGVFTGVLPALVAARASAAGGAEIPYLKLVWMTLLVLITGITVLTVMVRQVRSRSLVSQLRRE